MIITIPIKTVSESNRGSEHWTTKHKRHKKQKKGIGFVLNPLKPPELPFTIKLIRIAPRKLDEGDNLPSSFKWIRDAIADWITPNLQAGRADDNELIKWEYGQEKGLPKDYAIRIEIEKN